jgi:hypothetical protein
MGSSTDDKSVGEELHLETLNTSGVVIENVPFTDIEARHVRRRLDMWLMPILMISYALQ